VDERRRSSLWRVTGSYAFEYACFEQADKHANTNFKFETYDTYSWYLNSARCPTSNRRSTSTDRCRTGNSIVAHPDYDGGSGRRGVGDHGEGAFVPNLNVAGFWDQEIPGGPGKSTAGPSKAIPTVTN